MDFTNGKNRNDLLLSPQKERYHRVSIFAGNDYLFAYNYMGDVSILEYMNYNMDAYWMNPQNGSLSYIDTFYGISEITVRPTKRRELSNDWVLVLKKND
ncbi:MAG: putative collagen-binding domain-containing protein [Anaeroplasma sp.]